jgi:predicted Fe-Mo cluster-binding NifX family protein
MIVAFAIEGQQVAQHFGHAPFYKLFKIEQQRIVSVEVIPNPGHRPGYLPVFLHEHGVEVMITGGMGESALKLFQAQEIRVITGISGHPDRVIDQYLADELKPNSEPCGHHHEHHGHP